MISMKKVRKIAMYGGSFDPIHNAHVNIAQAFIKKLKLDKLLFIPAGQAPHKAGSDAAPDRHRLAMCELAVTNVKKAEVSDIELKRQGKSYTADTLSELSQLYPDSELYLIMGADMFMTLDTWYKPDSPYKIKFGYENALNYGYVDFKRQAFHGRRVLTTDDYVNYCGTHSDHLTIPEPYKTKFFNGLREAVDEFGGTVIFNDTYELMTVRKPLE